MSSRAAGVLALLLALATLFIIGAGGSYYLEQIGHGSAAHALPAEALLNLAIDANGALSGDARSLERLQADQKALEDVASRNADAPFATDARFTRVMSNASVVLKARSALADAGSAAHDTGELVPRLNAEAATLATALAAAPGSASAAALERFAARAQRLQLDVSALAQGTADPAAAAQRMAEASDYLGQVISGFAGGSSTLGLPHVVAPEAAAHLKTLDALYSLLTPAVKRAVAAAPALPGTPSPRMRASSPPRPPRVARSRALRPGCRWRCWWQAWRCSSPGSSRRFACVARPSGSAARRTCSARRATATSRRSCACSMNSRAWRTGI
jgi:hypothetical protein